MQRKILIESQFFPCTYFFALLEYGNLVLEVHEHYQKRSFRNKCIIANGQGCQILTVPLKKGKHEQQLIREVKIAYRENWQRNHLLSIRSAYGRAPFFDHYFGEISDLYQMAKIYLCDFNLLLINYVITRFDLKEISLSLAYKPSDIWKDLSGAITPANFRRFCMSPTYSQVFEDRHQFIPNLSILDLIFCCGPATALILKEPQGTFPNHPDLEGLIL